MIWTCHARRLIRQLPKLHGTASFLKESRATTHAVGVVAKTVRPRAAAPDNLINVEF